MATKIILISRQARRALHDLRNESRAVQRAGNVRPSRIIMTSANILEEDICRLEGEKIHLSRQLEDGRIEQDKLQDENSNLWSALLECREDELND